MLHGPPNPHPQKISKAQCTSLLTTTQCTDDVATTASRSHNRGQKSKSPENKHSTMIQSAGNKRRQKQQRSRDRESQGFLRPARNRSIHKQENKNRILVFYDADPWSSPPLKSHPLLAQRCRLDPHLSGVPKLGTFWPKAPTSRWASPRRRSIYSRKDDAFWPDS